jgi:putative membrane protein
MVAMMHWWYVSGWGSVLTAVSMVVFWGLVVGAIVLIVRAVGADSTSTPPADADPRQILAQRFARGEIDETDYRNRLAALRASPTPVR